MKLKQTYAEELAYIHAYWDKIIRFKKTRRSSLRNFVMRLGYIKLPNPVVAPNHRYFAGTQFYWDTYFNLLGLYDDGRNEVAAGLIDNELFLFEKYGIILARNSQFSRGRSQPPFLTSMIEERRKHDKTTTKAWLERAYGIATREYEEVWCTVPRLNGKLRLSHYHPRWFPLILRKYESGWDLSTRFEGFDMRIIPIDLNCLLYKYEKDLEAWARECDDRAGAKKWKLRAAERKLAIDTYLWDEQNQFYFDRHYGAERPRELHTLAAYFALWAGVASAAQAKACVQKLDVFLKPGGLVSTEPLPWKKRQWDYPNGWANLQFIAIQGLLNYGYQAEAEQIALRWLDLNSRLFKKTGKLWEKYDVVRCKVGLPGRYPTESGFGWTNAVFSRLCRLFDQPRP